MMKLRINTRLRLAMKNTQYLLLCLIGLIYSLPLSARANPKVNNVVLFVADGLRSGSVDEMSSSPFFALRTEGVWLSNSHSLFPTLTTANASALATGHYLGDTGDFGNTILAHADLQPLSEKTGAVPYLESNAVLKLMNEKYGEDYLHEESLIEAADRAGYSVAVIGKIGPTAIQNLKGLTDGRAIIIDDHMGKEGGVALPPDLQQDIQALCSDRSTVADSASDTTQSDCLKAAESSIPNTRQQQQFIQIVTQVILPRFVKASKPFLLIYWSRDPDKSQHGQKDDELVGRAVGINGPTSKAAIENAGQNLLEIRNALHDLKIDDQTNVIVTADHGFSTIDKSAHGSVSAQSSYEDLKQAGQLPPGFLAIDLARFLGLKLFDPDQAMKEVRPNSHPSKANGWIGTAPDQPQVIVAANGGSDLIYVTSPIKQRAAFTQKLIHFLSKQAYVGGLFVNDALGASPAALPLSEIGLCGSALTVAPSLVVSFATSTKLCDDNPKVPWNPELCAYAVADTVLQQGQGMHGTFSRADTHNFMAAYGPNFKKGFEDPMPASNADIAVTIAEILKLQPMQKGVLRGRVLAETYPEGLIRPFQRVKIASSIGKKGQLVTYLLAQEVGTARYFDAAGFLDRMAGLDEATRAINSPIRLAKPRKSCGIQAR